MRHSSMDRIVALAFCGLPHALGCSGSDTSHDGGGAGTTDAASGGRRDMAPPDANPVCETLGCFSACSEQIAVAALEQPMGFVAVPTGSTAFHTMPLGADMVLAFGPAIADIRKASDLSLVGSVALPGIWRFQEAVVGNSLFVGDGYGNIAALDLSNPAAPRTTAWWLSAGVPVGSWRGQLVLDGSYGISLLDVANPLAPVESWCAPGIGAEFVSGDTLVGRGDGATVYRLDPERRTAALWATIPMGDSALFAMDGQRLVIPAAGGGGWDVGLYDLGGNAPVEVARHEQLYHPYLWSNSGFFFEAESSDLTRTIAYDMRAAFEPYSVASVAGSECLYRLDARNGSASFVISGYLPGMRFSPDALPPVHCPVEDTVYGGTAAALSPDGHTLLLPGSNGWVFRDLDTGTDSIKGGGEYLPDDVAWIGDRLLAVKKLLATEVSGSWATIYDAANPQTEVAKVNGLDPYTEWLGASNGLLVGFTDSSSDDIPPYLSRLDPQAATVASRPIPLPAKRGYQAQLWKDRLIVFSDSEAILFDLDAVELSRVALPSSFAGATTRLVDELGWFATTKAGELLRLDPATGNVAVGTTGCVACRLLGADGKRVYVQASGPEALAPLAPPPGSDSNAEQEYSRLSYPELRAYGVTNDSYALVGRYPLGNSSMGWRLLVGSKLAMVGTGALILTAPP
jgi:hypothetical protein